MLARAAATLLLALSAAGCQLLPFLKAPSVPRKRGASVTERGPAFAGAGMRRAATEPGADWMAYNGSYTGERFSPLAQIDTANVGGLRRVCTFPIGEQVSMQSGPVVVGGTLYLTTHLDTYAIDAATCALRWRHRYAYTPAPDFDLKVNRGVAYLDGMLFRGANDGRVYALEAASGEELWNVVAADPKRGETFPAAPIAWDGRVYIGNAGGDNFGVRGRMMAFDARSGGRLWSVELVAEHGPESATWPPTVELVPRTGGATWTSYTLDTARGTLFVPTGNPGPDFLASVRAGDNLYTTSVVELDARTGRLTRWHQLTPADFHDWDQAAAPVLLAARGGRQLIAAGSKDGHLYGIDRATGRRLYATPVATIENVQAPLTAEGTRFCPGVNGGVEWNGPAYSPLTGALYVGSIDWCSTVKLAPPEELEGKRAIPWTGSSQLKRPFGTYDTKRKGWLTAVSADDGSVRWRYDSPTPLVAGVTTTAGGLVFTADLAGSVMAFDAASGRERWRASTGQPVGGGIVTYAVRGKQYVAVASGMHSPVAWQIESTPATLVVFALP